MERIAKKPILREDLYEFHFPSEVSISPDEGSAAYLVTQPEKEGNTYKTSLWAVNLENKSRKLLSARGQIKNPVWLDEETILFASDREKEKDEKQTNYYSISLTGGEAFAYMTVPFIAEKILPISKEKFLVLTTAEEQEEGEWSEEGADYYILEELPFWFNGKGIRSRKRTALFVYERATNIVERVSPNDMDIAAFAVSPNKDRLVYSGSVYHGLLTLESPLFLYDFETKDHTCLVEDGLYKMEHVAFMGRDQVFYTGASYERVGKNPQYYLYDLTKRTVKNLPFCDTPIGNSVSSDMGYGSGKSIVHSESDGLLYMLHTCRGDTRLVAMDMDGGFKNVCTTPGSITDFDVRGGTIVMAAMREQHLAELYSLSAVSGKEEQLTAYNRDYRENHLVSLPELISYVSKNGYTMEGYVLKPIGYEPGKTYPSVLQIHGGPKVAYGSVFFHEMQCLASDGYFVFFTNPRGSAGRGEAFADITEALGKDDFDDLMEFTDRVLERYPGMDAERVGICGGSYGGFMCNWMIGHTNRYKAAVSQRSISNYLTKMLYTDIGFYVNRLQIGAYPWEDFEKVWSMSPLSSAANAKTPLLLIQSDEDYRCWMGDAFQMFSAVKRQTANTRMILFHGENHELSRSGKPRNRVTRLKEMEEWFAKHL